MLQRTVLILFVLISCILKCSLLHLCPVQPAYWLLYTTAHKCKTPHHLYYNLLIIKLHDKQKMQASLKSPNSYSFSPPDMAFPLACVDSVTEIQFELNKVIIIWTNAIYKWILILSSITQPGITPEIPCENKGCAFNISHHSQTKY